LRGSDSSRRGDRVVLVVGVLVFSGVAVVLHVVAGLATWAAIAIPALAVGVLAGIAARKS
jgi:hypothetical protein